MINWSFVLFFYGIYITTVLTIGGRSNEFLNALRYENSATEVRDSLQISHGGVDREEPPVFPETDTRSAVNRRAFQNSYIVAADSPGPSEKTARREETFNF